MGGVKDAIMGKPAEQNQKNRAYDDIEHYMQPGLGYYTQGGDAIAGLLGVGAPRVGTKAGQYSYEGGGAGGAGGAGGGQAGALDNWANSGGMDFLMRTMQKGVTSSKAAKGLLGSGSYGTALQDRAMGLGSTYLNQYMDHLFKLSNLGLGGAGAMAGAGSTGSSTGAKQGIGPMIAQGVGAAVGASDRRLKENIVPLGNGLYEFDYKQDTPFDLPLGRHVGYMADEVPDKYVVKMKDGFKGVKAPYLPKRIN